jgi:membrane fusion protein (multidrug efflux system)
MFYPGVAVITLMLWQDRARKGTARAVIDRGGWCMRFGFGRLPVVLAGAMALGGLLMAAPGWAQRPNQGPPAVGVARAERKPIIETNEFIGRIESINRVALVARVNAFLDKRLFTEGSEVKTGDLLYQLEEGPFKADVDAKQAALAQANAQLVNATVTRARAQALLNTVAGQRSNYDTALATERSDQAQVLAAQANLEASQINYSYTQIKSPIDGKISRTAVTEGNVVSPTSGTLATIVSQDPMYVVFPVSSRSALELRTRYAGQGFNAVRVKIRLPTGDIYTQDGKLDYIDPTISSSTDTLNARAEIPNPMRGDGKTVAAYRTLIDGEFVQVLVEGLTPIEVLGVPRDAVLSDQQGDYVFTVDADNVVHQTRVTLGQSTPVTASVVSGLQEGEEVIVDGVQRVRPGIKVIPGPASPGPPGASAPAGTVH